MDRLTSHVRVFRIEIKPSFTLTYGNRDVTWRQTGGSHSTHASAMTALRNIVRTTPDIPIRIVAVDRFVYEGEAIDDDNVMAG